MGARFLGPAAAHASTGHGPPAEAWVAIGPQAGCRPWPDVTGTPCGCSRLLHSQQTFATYGYLWCCQKGQIHQLWQPANIRRKAHMLALRTRDSSWTDFVAEGIWGHWCTKNSRELTYVSRLRCQSLPSPGRTTSEHNDVLLIQQGPLEKCAIAPPPEYHFPAGVVRQLMHQPAGKG